jgi:hypothetical protein
MAAHVAAEAEPAQRLVVGAVDVLDRLELLPQRVDLARRGAGLALDWSAAAPGVVRWKRAIAVFRLWLSRIILKTASSSGCAESRRSAG